jgi:hypothetical protein
MKLLILVLFVSTYSAVSAQNCKPLGTLNVFEDPTCSSAGGSGCNAGGQGQNCRFCGFDMFPACPENKPSTPATTKTTVSTTKRTTVSTTKRTTVATSPREPSNSTDDQQQPNPQPWPQPVEEEFEYNEFGEKLIFSDDFETLDFRKWKHDLTMSGGGNWEFQLYHNNRTNSFVKDGMLYIHPTLTEDRVGADKLMSERLDMWGGSPVDQCTGNNL